LALPPYSENPGAAHGSTLSNDDCHIL